MIKIHTEKAPAAVGPYSQAIVSNGMVYTSGQIAINPLTNSVEADDIAGQTEQIMQNLGEILKTAGSSFSKAVKTTCYLADMSAGVPGVAVLRGWAAAGPHCPLHTRSARPGDRHLVQHQIPHAAVVVRPFPGF